MDDFIAILFLIFESFLAFSFIFIFYGLRKKIGYIPFYSYITFLVLLTRLVDNFGLTIHIGEFSFFIGSSVIFTSILLGLFIVYVFDGPEAGRMAAMVVIVTTMALVAVHYLFQTHTFFLKQPSGLLIENIDLRFYAVSIFALSGDLILLGIAWEFSSRFRRKIPLMLRIFSVLLMTMWLDVFLFVPGAFWETPDLLQNIYVSLLTRFTLTVLALPFLWLFFFWEQKNKGFSFEERPIFAIVQSFAILNEQDLMRIRADRSEEALRESETRFNLAFSKVPTPLMLHAEDGEILLVNEMWEGISGYPIKELPNIVSWTRRAYGENAPEIQHIIQKNFNIHSTVHEGEYEIRTKNGESKIWDFSSAPLGELLDGRKIVMSMAVDITARKKAEIEFIEQERRYREMIENVGLIATMLDSEGSIVYVNDFLLDLTGWQREEIVGKNWFETFVSEMDFNEVQQVFIDTLVSGEMSTYHENTIVTKSGKESLIRWSNIMLTDYGGEVIGAASIGEDITERKEIEDKINRLNEELESQVQLRTAELKTTVADLESFAYSVSHDLRAPLRGIKGYIDILSENYLQNMDDEGKRYFASVAESAVRMDELIKGLLSFSRLGRQGLKVQTLDFDDIVAEVRKEINIDNYKKADIRIDDLGVHQADRNLIKQVYVNLIENALKFSTHVDTPSVHVGITNQQDQIVFFVKDNGIGFDMSYVDKIFGVFQRLHGSESYTGSGIGLSIVQRIIQRHGGEIWVESVVGQGATFYFTLSNKLKPDTPDA